MALSRRSLSDLEVAILQALANGLHSKEIALCVQRSKPTIEGYVKQLCLKFDARSRAQLVAKALCQGALPGVAHSLGPEISAGSGVQTATAPLASGEAFQQFVTTEQARRRLERR